MTILVTLSLKTISFKKYQPPKILFSPSSRRKTNRHHGGVDRRGSLLRGRSAGIITIVLLGVPASNHTAAPHAKGKTTQPEEPVPFVSAVLGRGSLRRRAGRTATFARCKPQKLCRHRYRRQGEHPRQRLSILGEICSGNE